MRNELKTYTVWARKFQDENGIDPYPGDAWMAQEEKIKRLRRALSACAAVCAGENLNKSSLTRALELARDELGDTEKPEPINYLT
jgi:hypothetical protein